MVEQPIFFKSSQLVPLTDVVLNEHFQRQQFNQPSQPEKTTLEAALLISIAIVTIVGNAFLIKCIFTEKVFRTATNNFVFSLACASFMVGIVTIPAEILHIFFKLNSLCTLWLFTDFVAMVIINFNIVCICFVRYVAIVHPLFYSRSDQRKTICLWAPIVVWPLSILAGVPNLISDTKHIISFDKCTTAPQTVVNNIYMPLMSFLFLLSNCVVLVLLLLIRRSLQQRSQEVTERRYSMVVLTQANRTTRFSSIAESTPEICSEPGTTETRRRTASQNVSPSTKRKQWAQATMKVRKMPPILIEANDTIEDKLTSSASPTTPAVEVTLWGRTINFAPESKKPVSFNEISVHSETDAYSKLQLDHDFVLLTNFVYSKRTVEQEL